MKSLLPVLLFLAAATLQAQTLFEGRAVGYHYLFPSISSTYYQTSFTVGPGVELPGVYGSDYATVDVSDTNITVDFYASGTWSTADFNGFRIHDLNSTLPDFTSVTINPSTNMVGLDASRINFDANNIYVNWQGLSWNPNTIVSLDVGSLPLFSGLDTAFSSDGKVTTIFPGLTQVKCWAMTAASDGKIIMAGEGNTGSRAEALVARFHPNGDLDTGFDGDGWMTIPVGTGGDTSRGVAVQADGKIVVCGRTSNGSNLDAFVLRLNANGGLDTTFDGDGKLVWGYGASSDDEANAVAMTSDQKIVVAGDSDANGPYDFAVARLNSNGSFDNGFDGDGKKLVDFGGSTDLAYGMAIDPSDQSLVIVGAGYVASYDLAIVRLNSSGAIVGGKPTMDFSGNTDFGMDVAIQSDGKIVVSGFANNGSNHDVAVARFLANGNPDNSFSGDGKATTAIGTGNDVANAVKIDGSGRIVLAAEVQNGAEGNFGVARFTSSGALDTSFNGNGRGVVPVSPGTDKAYDLVIDGFGRILLGGTANEGTGGQFALARLFGEPPPDVQVEYPVGTVLADGAGTLAFGGTPISTSASRTLTIRNTGGTPLTDLSISISGADASDFTPGTLSSTTLAPGASTTLEVTFTAGGFGPKAATLSLASSDMDENPYEIALTGSGTSQTPIAADLTVRAPDPGETTPIYSTASNVTEPDGEAVVLTVVSNNAPGTATIQSGVLRVSLTSVITTPATITVRATDPHGLFDDAVILLTAAAEGSPDPTFDGDGSGTGIPSGYGMLGFSGVNAVIQDLKVQADGKVVAVGNKGMEAIIARYNANGTVDGGFGTGGSTVTPWGTTAVFQKMALQPDGKTVAVGYTVVSGSGRYLVARFTTSGAHDPTFDGDGIKVIDVGPTADIGTDVAIQADGKIVLSGYSYTGSNYSQSAVRLDTNGGYDLGFDGDGKVTVPYAENSLASSLALVAGGKIVLAGHTNVSGLSDFCAVRLDSNGAVDASFGNSGRQIVSLSGSHDYCEAMVVQADGKLILAGRLDGPPEDFALLRLDGDGAIDNGFGTGGKVVFPASPASYDRCADIALQPDGKIVAAGVIAGSFDDMSLIRFNADGTHDAGFSASAAYLQPGNLDDGLLAVEVEADGDIIAGGYSDDASGVQRMAVVKLNGFGAEPDITVEHPVATELTDGGPAIDCGLVAIGQTVSKTFTIRNNGFQTLHLTPSVTVSVPGSFIDNGIPFTSLAPGASGEYTFTFQAQVPGPHSATLKFISNDADESPFDITLTCEGTAPEIAVFNGAAELADGQAQVVDLGETVIGNHVVHSLTIHNQGNAPLTVSAIQLPSGLEIQSGTPALPVTIPAGTSIPFGIFFGTQIGVFQGSVEISCNDTDETVFNFPVSAVVNGIPEIALEHPVGVDLPHGSGLQFGTLASGRGTAAKTVTIRNTGNGPLAVSSISITGANASEFPMTAPAAPLEIAPGGQETLTITFTPAGTTSGGRFGTLEIHCDDPDESLLSRSLEGLGLSTTADNDGDGMNDWAEYRLAGLGFDWNVNQVSMVNALYDGANDAGLYTPSQVQALHTGTPLISRNPTTGTFKLTMDWKKSTNLEDFFDFPAPANSVSVNPQGDIELEFTSPDDAAFFRVEAR